MAQAPVKPTTTTTSKPNPLHGETQREGTPMPGTGPKSDMAPHVAPAEVPATDATRDEMNEGKKALTNVEERTKAEMDVGKQIIGRHPEAAKSRREHKEEDEE